MVIVKYWFLPGLRITSSGESFVQLVNSFPSRPLPIRNLSSLNVASPGYRLTLISCVLVLNTSSRCANSTPGCNLEIMYALAKGSWASAAGICAIRIPTLPTAVGSAAKAPTDIAQEKQAMRIAQKEDHKYLMQELGN